MLLPEETAKRVEFVPGLINTSDLILIHSKIEQILSCSIYSVAPPTMAKPSFDVKVFILVT